MQSLADRIQAANKLLHPNAVPHEGKFGRRIEEIPDQTRFTFQRDRDRILHSNAFRRLQGKTQVFVAGEGDHFRTRLTHTMEVAQISRDIARAMGLNEDLAECIALAHDLGHPPFGHTGEEALDAWMLEHGQHFEHNEQSYRIVTVLEKHSSQYAGLNLNREVEEGLLKHSMVHPSLGHAIERSLEAEVANLCDEIAYISHDCDDGITADLFSVREVSAIPLAGSAYEISKARGSYIRSALVRIMVEDVLETSVPFLSNSPDDGPRVLFSAQLRTGVNELREFLATRMYPHPRIRVKADEGKQIVDLLCRHYYANPSEKIANIRQRTGASLVEAVKDYVAGMTDSFAWLQAADLGLLPVVVSTAQALEESPA
jgi:dGTPase